MNFKHKNAQNFPVVIREVDVVVPEQVVLQTQFFDLAEDASSTVTFPISVNKLTIINTGAVRIEIELGIEEGYDMLGNKELQILANKTETLEIPYPIISHVIVTNTHSSLTAQCTLIFERTK